jgi:hypothetical protein
VAQTKIRIDVWGFGDILALDARPGALLIQATTTSNCSSRVSKIVNECTDAARAWLDAGNRIEVWGWALRGTAGKRKLWTLKIYEITLEQLKGATA